MYIKLWPEKTQGTAQIGRPKYGWEDNIKYFLEDLNVRVWIDLSWLRIWFNSRVLWTQKWTFGFHEGGEFVDQQSSYQLLKTSCTVKLINVLRKDYNIVSTCLSDNHHFW